MHLLSVMELMLLSVVRIFSNGDASVISSGSINGGPLREPLDPKDADHAAGFTQNEKS